MTGFKTKCPSCKKEELYIVSGNFDCGGVKLTKDGFSFTEADYINTQDEVVECFNCHKRLRLDDLLP